jgi:catechol 2,3-dioxygenase-like lactoylglutathione lyase family enzyme
LGGPRRRTGWRPQRHRDDADPGRSQQAGADEISHPAAIGARPPNPPVNTLGLHRVMFAVDDIDDTVAHLRPHGAELLGEVAQYADSCRLCYLRGPAGIVLALAEQIS